MSAAELVVMAPFTVSREGAEPLGHTYSRPAVKLSNTRDELQAEVSEEARAPLWKAHGGLAESFLELALSRCSDKKTSCDTLRTSQLKIRGKCLLIP